MDKRALTDLLAANDIAYMDHIKPPSEYVPDVDQTTVQRGTLMADTKHGTLRNPSSIKDIRVARRSTRYYQHKSGDEEIVKSDYEKVVKSEDKKIVKSEDKKMVKSDDGKILSMSKFVDGLPYGFDTTFGYTTLIDPKQELKKLADRSNAEVMNQEDFGLNRAELKSIDLLIDGMPFH